MKHAASTAGKKVSSSSSSGKSSSTKTSGGFNSSSSGKSPNIPIAGGGLMGGLANTVINTAKDVAGSTLQQTAPSAVGDTRYTDANGNRQNGIYLSPYDQQFMSQEDLAKISALKAAAQAGTTSWEDANKAAEAYRAKYGYSGGPDGSKYIPLEGWTAPAPSAPQIPNAYEGYGDALKSYQQEQEELARRQFEASIQQAQNSLSGQKDTVNQQYDELARQMYIDRRMNEKKLPQQMAAMGYNGGTTESAALGLQTSYQDALRQGETARNSTLSSLDQAIINAKLSGDIALAQQLTELAQNTMGLYTQSLGNIQNTYNQQAGLDMQAGQWGYQAGQDALAQQNYLKQLSYSQAMDEWNKEQSSYDRKLELAKTLAAYGDFSGFKSMGYTDAQIAQMRKDWVTQLYL